MEPILRVERNHLLQKSSATGNAFITRLFVNLGILIVIVLLALSISAVAATPALQLQSTPLSSPHISPDNRLFAEKWNGVITFWDGATGRVLRKLRLPGGESGQNICFPDSGDIVASLDGGGGITFWDPMTGSLREQIDLDFTPECFDGGGLYLQRSGLDKVDQFMPISAKNLIERPTISTPSHYRQERLVQASENRVIGVARFTSIGRNDIDSPPQATLRIYDAKNGQFLHELVDLATDLSLNTHSISISPDGRLVAYVEQDRWPEAKTSYKVPGPVIVIDVRDGKPLRLNSLKNKSVLRTAFVNKGTWLMIAGEDPGWIEFVDIESDTVVKRFEGTVNAIGASNEEKIILTLTGESSARVMALPSFSPGAKVGRETSRIQELFVNGGKLYLSAANRIIDIGLSNVAEGLNLEKDENSFFRIDNATGQIIYLLDEDLTKLRLRKTDGHYADIHLPKGEMFWDIKFMPSGKLLAISCSLADVMKIGELDEQDLFNNTSEAEKLKARTAWRAYLISDSGKVERLGQRRGLPSAASISPNGRHFWIAIQDMVVELALPTLKEGKRIRRPGKVNKIHITKDDDVLWTSSGDRIVAWDLMGNSMLAEFKGQFIQTFEPLDQNQVLIAMRYGLYRWSYAHKSKEIFSPPYGSVIAEDLSRYAIHTSDGSVEIVSLSNKKTTKLSETICRIPIRFSSNGQLLICKNQESQEYDPRQNKNRYSVVDADTGAVRRDIPIRRPSRDRGLPAFSADAARLFYIGLRVENFSNFIQTVVMLDMISGQETLLTDLVSDQHLHTFASSEDSRLIAFGSTILGIGGKDAYIVEIFQRSADRYELISTYTSPTRVRSLDVNPQGDLIAISNESSIVLLNPASGTVHPTIPISSTLGNKVRFSKDGKSIAGINLSNTQVSVFDTHSGELRQTYLLETDLWAKEDEKPFISLTRAGVVEPRGRSAVVHSLSLEDSLLSQETLYEGNGFLSGFASLNSDKVALWGDDDLVTLFDVRKREVVGYVAMFAEGQWAAVTVDGRFDVSSFKELIPMHWIMPDDPMRALPLEIFMRDYYEPRLLPRLLAGENFQNLPPLDQLNRAQPKVIINHVQVENAQLGLVAVTVEVSSDLLEISREGNLAKMQSDAYDLRLFRDGQLVAQSPEPAEITSYSEQTREEELAEWRHNHKIIGLDPVTGKKTVRFRGIRLPQIAGLKEVEFSAYAFNVDRVKSATAHIKFEIPKDLMPRQPYAYVVTIGANGFEGEAMSRLSYAANDARGLSKELGSRLKVVRDPETGKLLFGDANVVPISLITEFGTDSQVDKLVINQATKDRIKAVIEKLAGKPVDDARLAGIINADKLRPALPEDLVIIAFSTHGDTDRQGEFYLMPYDLGISANETDIRKNAISTQELSGWLRTLDAGELVMIVDACHSAATVESGEFKPGPMGSRGLGQLAFDKGMRILAASQRDQYALETEKTQQGLLSYALVHEGLKENAADYKRKDGRIELSEWLNYGVERVPGLYQDYRHGKLKARTATPLDEPEKKNFISMQQPALFDFARGRNTLIFRK